MITDRAQRIPPNPTPAIGRVVHYVANGRSDSEPGTHKAALITKVNSPTAEGGCPTVGLTVFLPPPEVMQTNQYAAAIDHIPYSETPKAGTWHWPERVEEERK